MGIWICQVKVKVKVVFLIIMKADVLRNLKVFNCTFLSEFSSV